MEACEDLSEVSSAVSITRRWLREAASAMDPQTRKFGPQSQNQTPECALLVIDLGNSTQVLLGGKDDAAGAVRLEQAIVRLCKSVHRLGGSIMSFTGDGYVAVFEERHFSGATEAALSALMAADEACAVVTGDRNRTTIRAALHWGRVYIPSSGSLRDQVIGSSVVCATRLCEWLKEVEKTIPPRTRGAAAVATLEFVSKLGAKDQHEWQAWKEWGPLDLKGLLASPTIYLRS